MRKVVTLFVLAASFLLDAYAQETWNAVKMFDFDAHEVQVMQIDTIGAADDEIAFSFLTSYVVDSSTFTQKIIRTNTNGEFISETDYPYPFGYYTVMDNGDTLITAGNYVINVTRQDTIYYTVNICYAISATSSGIYVYMWDGTRHYPFIMNIVNKEKIFNTSNCSVCRSGDGIYAIISSEDLYYYDEHTKEIIKTKINVNTPITGIAEYKGSLYVYSQTDKAVYRLEPPEVVTSVSSNRAEVEQTAYYNLLGEQTDTPSGLTIVVTRYSDGSVRTEKKLFR